MRSAPMRSAWSRNALNFISALQRTSGLGVRPARYSARKLAKTRSRYSAAKFTASMSMPMRSAAETASTRSSRVEQYSSSSSSSQFFMKRPVTSWPARFSSSAATAESTPPDMPTTPFMARFQGPSKSKGAEPKPRPDGLLAGYFFGAAASFAAASFLPSDLVLPVAAAGALGVLVEAVVVVASFLAAFSAFLASFLAFLAAFFSSFVGLASADFVVVAAGAAVVVAAVDFGASGVFAGVACANTEIEADANSTAIRADSLF